MAGTTPPPSGQGVGPPTSGATTGTGAALSTIAGALTDLSKDLSGPAAAKVTTAASTLSELSTLVKDIPVAEDGLTTSEFKVTAAVTIVSTILLLLDLFGVIRTTDTQRTGIAQALIALIGGVNAVYAAFRNIRKQGTTA
jgi:hypothetical protein